MKLLDRITGKTALQGRIAELEEVNIHLKTELSLWIRLFQELKNYHEITIANDGSIHAVSSNGTTIIKSVPSPHGRSLS